MSFFRKHLKHISVTILGFSGLAFAVAGVACQNHIYNNSKRNWTIAYYTNSSNSHVSLSGAHCPSGSSQCSVEPGQTLEVDYIHSAPADPSGTVAVLDDTGKMNSYKFESDGARCEYIKHSGDTDAISVNDPANGDISIWHDHWSQNKKNS